MKTRRFDTLTIDGLRWRIAADFRAEFDSCVRPALEDPDAASGTTRIKHNMVRTVWRLPLPSGTVVYLKHYRVRTLADRLKALIRGSKAAMEFRAARRIAARGLSTIEPLAVGERRRGPWVDECLLISREVPHEDALGPYLERLRDTGNGDEEAQRIRQRLIVVLGHYVWKLHRSGVRHGDFHGGNLLVTLRPDGRPYITLIDLHAASTRLRLGARYRVRSLATLLHSLRLGLSQTDRLRLLRAYEDAAAFSRTRREVWNRQVMRVYRRVHRANMRSRSRRCLRVSSMFDRREDRAQVVFRRRAYPFEEVRRILDAHAEAVRTGRGAFLKQSRRVRVTLQERGVGERAERFAVKECFEGGPWALFKNLLFGSRGRRAWFAGHAFAVRGLSTALTVALHERKRWGLVAESTVVTAYLEDKVDAKRLFFERWGSKGKLSRDEIRSKRAFLQVLARDVRRLHDSDLYHNDLSGKNLFVAAGPEAPSAVYFLDLESVRMRRRLTRARRAKNLSQVIDSLVGAHTSDARRLLRYYAAGTEFDTRAFAEEVDRAVQERRRRRSLRQAAREAGRR